MIYNTLTPFSATTRVWFSIKSSELWILPVLIVGLQSILLWAAKKNCRSLLTLTVFINGDHRHLGFHCLLQALISSANNGDPRGLCETNLHGKSMDLDAFVSCRLGALGTVTRCTDSLPLTTSYLLWPNPSTISHSMHLSFLPGEPRRNDTKASRSRDSSHIILSDLHCWLN